MQRARTGLPGSLYSQPERLTEPSPGMRESARQMTDSLGSQSQKRSALKERRSMLPRPSTSPSPLQGEMFHHMHTQGFHFAPTLG